MRLLDVLLLIYSVGSKKFFDNRIISKAKSFLKEHLPSEVAGLDSGRRCIDMPAKLICLLTQSAGLLMPVLSHVSIGDPLRLALAWPVVTGGFQSSAQQPAQDYLQPCAASLDLQTARCSTLASASESFLEKPDVFPAPIAQLSTAAHRRFLY